jgi:hypothetical protein
VLELALIGPSRSAIVIATTPHAVYLEVADPARTMICIASATAVRVPCALVLAPRVLPPQAPPGTPAQVGEGHVTISMDDANFRVHRWWRPPAPRGLGAVAPAKLAATVRWLTGQVADPLDAGGRSAVADLVAALGAGARPETPVSRLLGRGPGLTPTGDDVLAGALVTLRALGSPAAAPLSLAVRAKAPGATTAVSAALLRHAVEGRCIPQLGDLLTAVAENPAGAGAEPAATAGALARAAGALLAVGHCSGAGLLHGVLVALAIAHARLARDVVDLTRPAPPSVLPAPSPVAA